MKTWEFYVTTAIAALAVAITGIWLAFAQVNQSKVAQLQEGQNTLAKIQLRQQVTSNVIQQLAGASLKNEAIKGLLDRHDVTVTVNNKAGATK